MPLSPPVNFNDALWELPEDQHPYGEDCPINWGVQSLLFQYRIPADDVANLIIEEFFTRLDFKSANPDGNDEERQLYAETIAMPFTKPIRRRRIVLAVRRMLSVDPCAAVVASPPSPAPASGKCNAEAVDAPLLPKKVAGKKSPVQPASTSQPSTSASADKAKAPKLIPDVIDITDISDDSLSDADAESSKDVEDAGSVKPSSSSSHLRDLNAHFDDIADEVWVTLVCFD